MSTTRASIHIKAPPTAVYRALLDAEAVRHWMVPDGMTSVVHQFEPHEGGAFRISLTYEEPGPTGKTSARTDSHHGRFLTLVPDREVVQTTSFETDDPELQGEMLIRFTLTERDGGTQLVAVHEDVPPGVPPEDNTAGWQMSLGKLARLVEAG